MTDFIGDIHGHADKLEQLLSKLGYEKKNGTYSHSESKMIFVGDLSIVDLIIQESLTSPDEW